MIQIAKQTLIQANLDDFWNEQKVTAEADQQVSPLQKIRHILCAFIRTPHRLDESHAAFCRSDGQNVLDALRSLYPRFDIANEAEVWERATVAVDFMTACRRSYEAFPEDYIRRRIDNPESFPANQGGSLWQLKFDAIDRATENARDKVDLCAQLKLESYRFELAAKRAEEVENLEDEEHGILEIIALQLREFADNLDLIEQPPADSPLE